MNIFYSNNNTNPSNGGATQAAKPNDSLMLNSSDLLITGHSHHQPPNQPLASPTGQPPVNLSLQPSHLLLGGGPPQQLLLSSPNNQQRSIDRQIKSESISSPPPSSSLLMTTTVSPQQRLSSTSCLSPSPSINVNSSNLVNGSNGYVHHQSTNHQFKSEPVLSLVNNNGTITSRQFCPPPVTGEDSSQAAFLSMLAMQQYASQQQLAQEQDQQRLPSSSYLSLGTGKLDSNCDGPIIIDAGGECGEGEDGEDVPLPGFSSPESAFYQYQNRMEGQRCQVCGELAAGFHHGAYVCEACKKFFMRHSLNDSKPTNVCPTGGHCVVAKGSRGKCQICRYRKCLMVGMKLKDPESQPDVDISNIPCRVCGGRSSGFHFGALTCEGCKGFFRRTEGAASLLVCVGGQNACTITPRSRNACKSCRFRRCIAAGMSKKGSRIGRQPNAVKFHCAIEIRQLHSSPSATPHRRSSCSTSSSILSSHHRFESPPANASSTNPTGLPLMMPQQQNRSSLGTFPPLTMMTGNGTTSTYGSSLSPNDAAPSSYPLLPLQQSIAGESPCPSSSSTSTLMIDRSLLRSGPTPDSILSANWSPTGASASTIPHPHHQPPSRSSGVNAVSTSYQQLPHSQSTLMTDRHLQRLIQPFNLSPSTGSINGSSQQFSPPPSTNTSPTISDPTASTRQLVVHLAHSIVQDRDRFQIDEIDDDDSLIRPSNDAITRFSEGMRTAIEFLRLPNTYFKARFHMGTIAEEHRNNAVYVLDHMMNHFHMHSQQIVQFAKLVPGFNQLGITTRSNLVRGGMYHVVLLLLSRDYRPQTDEYNYFDLSVDERHVVMSNFPTFQRFPQHLRMVGYVMHRLNPTLPELSMACAVEILRNYRQLDEPMRSSTKELFSLAYFSLQACITRRYSSTSSDPSSNAESGVVRWSQLKSMSQLLQAMHQEHFEIVSKLKAERPELHFPELFMEMFQLADTASALFSVAQSYASDLVTHAAGSSTLTGNGGATTGSSCTPLPVATGGDDLPPLPNLSSL